MTRYEKDLLIAEHVLGWKWIVYGFRGGLIRALVPPDEVGDYDLWNGQECRVSSWYIHYCIPRFSSSVSPSTDPAMTTEIMICMEGHGFLCEINYFTGPAEPWCVEFRNFHVNARRVGGTLHEAIVRAVLDDEIMGHLEQA